MERCEKIGRKWENDHCRERSKGGIGVYWESEEVNFGMISGLGTENRGEKRERKGRQSLSKERIGAIVFYFGESEKRLSSWRH